MQVSTKSQTKTRRSSAILNKTTDGELSRELDRVLKSYVITFTEKEKSGGFLIAVVPRKEFYKKDSDYQQHHFTGDTFGQALSVVPDL